MEPLERPPQSLQGQAEETEVRSVSGVGFPQKELKFLLSQVLKAPHLALKQSQTQMPSLERPLPALGVRPVGLCFGRIWSSSLPHVQGAAPVWKCSMWGCVQCGTQDASGHCEATGPGHFWDNSPCSALSHCPPLSSLCGGGGRAMSWEQICLSVVWQGNWHQVTPSHVLEDHDSQ